MLLLDDSRRDLSRSDGLGLGVRRPLGETYRLLASRRAGKASTKGRAADMMPSESQ
jgi:hypothetical protein